MRGRFMGLSTNTRRLAALLLLSAALAATLAACGGSDDRETVAGVKLVDWVTRLIEGKPVGDVRCRKCRADTQAK
jgi:hypothetical protein